MSINLIPLTYYDNSTCPAIDGRKPVVIRLSCFQRQIKGHKMLINNRRHKGAFGRCASAARMGK